MDHLFLPKQCSYEILFMDNLFRHIYIKMSSTAYIIFMTIFLPCKGVILIGKVPLFRCYEFIFALKINEYHQPKKFYQIKQIIIAANRNCQQKSFLKNRGIIIIKISLLQGNKVCTKIYML